MVNQILLAHDPGDSQIPKISDPLHPRLMNHNHAEAAQLVCRLQQLVPDMSLSNIQAVVFLQSWEGKTYQQIADRTHYDSNYLRDVGQKLWRKLSAALGEPVTKSNVCFILRRHFHYLPPMPPSEFATPKLQPLNSSQFMALNLATQSECQPTCDWGEAATVPFFVDREAELSCLQQWISQGHTQLVGIFGLGGVGKTALAVKCVQQVQSQFDYIIWRSLRHQPDFNAFINGVLQCLTDQPIDDLPDAPDAQVSLLIQCLQQYRCLLVIDDWAAVLKGGITAGHYREKQEHYGLLARRISEGQHRSCVLIVSREKPIGSAFRDNRAFPVRNLYLQGLTRPAGQAALSAFGLQTTNIYFSDQLLQAYSGNPYALRVVATTIVNLFDGNIASFLKHNHLVYGDIRDLLDQHYSRLSVMEKQVLQSLAQRSEPIALAELEWDLALMGRGELLLELIESLYHRALIEKQGTGFSMPRFLRDYVACISPQEFVAADWVPQGQRKSKIAELPMAKVSNIHHWQNRGDRPKLPGSAGDVKLALETTT